MSSLGESILRGAQQAHEYAKDKPVEVKVHTIEVPEHIDVKSIREELHLSPNDFCNAFGFKISTLKKWERGERQPEGPTRAYLTVIHNNPEAVIDALNQGV